MTAQSEQAQYLSVLTQIPSAALKVFTEEILMQFDHVQVVENRTGLVMLPYTDSVKGTAFHLGEVLMSEALVTVQDQHGYGACLGRDLEQALAIAILDATLQLQDAARWSGLQAKVSHFVEEQAAAQQLADCELLRKVEATRVEMEVF